MENQIYDESQVSGMPRALKMGLTVGLIGIVIAVISGMMTKSGNSGASTALGWLSFLILVGGGFMAAKSHRDQDLGGMMSFGRGFLVAFVTIAIASILVAIFNYIYMGFIDPSMIDEIRRQAMENMDEQNMPEESYDMAVSMMESMTSAGAIAAMGSMFGLVGGAIFGAIIGAITKRTKD